MTKRLTLVLAGPIVAVVFVAGVHSLITGSSLRALIAKPPPELRTHFDAERLAAAARLPGPFSQHVDPRVGYVLRRSSTIDSVGVEIATDELGLRARTGPPAAADALRVIILGDSVAFGTGIGSEACLAQQIEDRIARDRETARRDLPYCCSSRMELAQRSLVPRGSSRFARS